MSSSATINGFLVRIREAKSGFLLAFKEPTVNHLQKPTFHHVAVWGEKAKAIRPHLEKGVRFECRCTIGYTTRDRQKFTNFTVITWKIIPSGFRPFKPREETTNDDWFVPDIIERDAPSSRRYEGFDKGVRP